MALLKYFKRVDQVQMSKLNVLPKANGAPSQLMPSSMMTIMHLLMQYPTTTGTG